MKCIDKFGA